MRKQDQKKLNKQALQSCRLLINKALNDHQSDVFLKYLQSWMGSNVTNIANVHSLCKSKFEAEMKHQGRSGTFPFEPVSTGEKCVVMIKSMTVWAAKGYKGIPSSSTPPPEPSITETEKLTDEMTYNIANLLIEIKRYGQTPMDLSALELLRKNYSEITYEQLVVENYSLQQLANYIHSAATSSNAAALDKKTLLDGLRNCCGIADQYLGQKWAPATQITPRLQDYPSHFNCFYSHATGSVYVLLRNRVTQPAMEAEIERAFWQILQQRLKMPKWLFLQSFSRYSPPNNFNPQQQQQQFVHAPSFKQPQVDTAHKMMDSLIMQGVLDDIEKYSGVDFRIFGPPNVSLSTQTKERVIGLLWGLLIPDETTSKATLAQLIQVTQAHGISLLDRQRRHQPINACWQLLDNLESVVASKVLSTCQFRKGKPTQQFLQLEKDIFARDSRGRRPLMLIFHDECHWGIKRNSQVDILFNGASYKGQSRPNISNPFCQSNVFIFHISATAWNMNVKGIEPNVVTWNTCPPGYTSQEFYTAPNCDRLKIDSDFDDVLKNAQVNSFSPTHPVYKYLPSIVLLVDYTIECSRLAGMQGETSLATTHTKWLFEHMNQAKKNETILIRLQKGGIQKVFLRVLKLLRAILPPQHGMQRFKIACPSLPDESELPFDASFESSAISHCPTIVLVVEKAKMGDTLPNLSAFDTRARYSSLSSKSCYSGFIQDIGRCFGYRQGQPPFLLVNQNGSHILFGATPNLDPFVTLPKKTEVRNHKELNNDVASAGSKSMWSRVLHDKDERSQTVLDHVKTNRFILQARPQVGKTGAFIYLLKLITEYFRERTGF